MRLLRWLRWTLIVIAGCAGIAFALAASGSPKAAQALLQHVGQANLADFVRTVMQA